MSPIFVMAVGILIATATALIALGILVLAA